MRYPKVWRLPFGAKVVFRYVNLDRMPDRALGWWSDFNSSMVGTIKIAKDVPPSELLDTLWHEMSHALIDWHSRCIWAKQREAEDLLKQEAARLAAERAEDET